MAQFTTLTSRVVLLPIDNVDTDQIIPARFLKTTGKAGLGDQLFADWRDNPDGSPKSDFALNRPEAQGAQILLAGDNFGCGSSREHAAWALIGFGFRAVIAASFADIFRSNALKNGLLPVTLERPTHAELLDMLGRRPEAELTIDLSAQTLRLPDGRQAHFPLEPFSKTCLLDGVDELGYLLRFEERIAAHEMEYGLTMAP